jgi:hypothetical protein
MNKKLITSVTFSLVVGLSSFCFGQQTLKTALKQYELGRYDLAIINFEEVLSNNSNELSALSPLAYCHLATNNLEASTAIYEMLVLRNAATVEDKINYAKVLTKLAKYNEAESIYNGMLAENAALVLPKLNNLTEIRPLLYGLADFEISNSLACNSKHADFGYSINNGIENFSSYRTDVLLPIDQALQVNQETAYLNYNLNGAKVKANWSDLSIKSNRGFISESNGIVAFSETDFIMPQSLCFDNMTSSIYFENTINGVKKETPFVHNEVGVVYAFPFLANEGNTLYFTSNRAGGFGGFDLYKSEKIDNQWQIPINLGKEINTAGNEVSCYIAEGKLYFSSDSHTNLGGYDLFSAVIINDEWTDVTNLGVGINTSRDEYFPYLNEGNIYFTSNRLEGNGAEDIYKATPIVNEFLVDVVPPAELLPEFAAPQTFKEENIAEVSQKTIINIDNIEHVEEMNSLAGARLVSIGELLPATNVYFIQLAALYNSKGNHYEFKRLAKYGNIYKIFQGGVVKIQLGYYYEESKANEILEKVKAEGFKDAFVTFLGLNTSQLELMISTPSNDTEGNEASTYTTQVDNSNPEVFQNNYKVRLASYEDPIWFDTKKIKDLGQIEQWSKGNWTIFIISGFKNYEEAKKAQMKAVNRGFIDSEIVIDRGGVLERLRKN